MSLRIRKNPTFECYRLSSWGGISAACYALGQVAKRYYAGGRTMNTALLQETFQNLLGPAKQMQQQYLPQIEQKAQSLDMTQVMNLVRGL